MVSAVVFVRFVFLYWEVTVDCLSRGRIREKSNNIMLTRGIPLFGKDIKPVGCGYRVELLLKGDVIVCCAVMGRIVV
jgi:hypothetical protein